MKPWLTCCSRGILILLLTACAAWAQGTAQLSGTVRDESGGVLPGVSITVTQTNTSAIRTAVSDETGGYVIPNLPVGPYRLKVALSGFNTYVQEGIVLQVNSNLTMNPVLQVGEVAQVVEVKANSELQVETRNMSIGTMMERERILELPLSGRKVTDLVVLTGAAVRLTDSGLGCENWPKCGGTPLPPLSSHALIEFGNRAVSAVVGVITVVVAFLTFVRRPFRRDLALLALALPLGVIAQAVLGGFTVTQHLAPGFVMAHFALSMVVLVAAVALA